MNDSERITAIAVIVALAQQKAPLSPKLQTELKEITDVQPLNFGTLHKFGTQEPLNNIYSQARKWLQSQASQRAKGALPIQGKADDSCNSLLVNYITQFENKENTDLEKDLKTISEAEDMIAAATATLTMTGFPGNLWSWIKRNLFTRR